MKIQKLHHIFPDPKLFELLQGGKAAPKKIKIEQVVHNLLRHDNPLFETRFLDSLAACQKFGEKCDKLRKKYNELKQAAYAKFPEEQCLLSKMGERADELKKHGHKLAEKLSDTIKERSAKDPLVFKDSHYSLRDSHGVIKSSDVRTKHQNFVLSCCPKTVKAARHYFERCMEMEATVFVALLESSEATSRCNNFWSSKFIHHHPDFGGIITSTSTKVWMKRKQEITETEIVFKNGKKATFFHHEHWKDHHPAPDRELIHALAQHVLQINGAPAHPIAINCRGGVGRTAVFAIYLFLRREVESQLAAGKSLDEVSLNIPETIHMFRRQRSGMLGRPAQLVQLYRLMHDFYEQKCKVQSA